ncbi:hypothetical protein KKF34_08240 [Myxococcota bacterium]|nr:hypothetical protein [Myxococcota bacterium]MBU1381605.1 hypothetical protein [Myxococcota bacterium]MBU1496851.1 hypothetical protein [Myxococcota bacterium]
MKLSNALKLVFFGIFFIFAACDDKSYNPPPPIDGGTDGDVVEDHVTPPDNIDANPEGPDIIITNPLSGATVASEFLQVRAVITSTSSTIDFNSCQVYIEGNYYSMTVDTGIEDGFKSTVDLSEIPAGEILVRVIASDTEGRTNYADTTFNLDKGPAFSILSPIDGERYTGAANLAFIVTDNDGVVETTVTAKIGDILLPLSVTDTSTETANGNPVSISFESDVVFNSSMFSPPLSGEQRIALYAENALGNDGSASVDFMIDNEGPLINITSHEPGQIIGSIITIIAEITDPAGVLSSSVVAVIGNNDTHYDIPLAKITGTNNYEGSFDTSVLPSSFIWPALQVFATDMLGNESSVAFELALDNNPPISSLDPPENFRLAKRNSDGDFQCTRPFDPVGFMAANDQAIVNQVFWLRARVEDTGNSAPGMAFAPMALVNQSTVEIYILDDVSNSLTVDTNSDGICDDINPLLVPTIQLTGSGMEALKLNMLAIPPTGAGDYQPDLGILPAACDLPGDSLTPPDALCPVTEADMTIAIWYTFEKDEPAIYTLPPVDSGSSLMCSGIQFDAWANNIQEGWACIAVKAIDNAGNVGVSAPMRVCIDYDPDDGALPADCQNLASAPNCTGTWNAVTGTVSATPCVSLTFSENQVRREL